MASSASENRLLLSKIAYDQNPFHPTENPEGVIQMDLAENQVWTTLFFFFPFPSTWLKSGLGKIPKPLFALLKELRSSETWPIFKTTMAYQMEEPPEQTSWSCSVWPTLAMLSLSPHHTIQRT
ncbi:unnamed protein product [Malus baccata var. baccata]